MRSGKNSQIKCFSSFMQRFKLCYRDIAMLNPYACNPNMIHVLPNQTGVSDYFALNWIDKAPSLGKNPKFYLQTHRLEWTTKKNFTGKQACCYAVLNRFNHVDAYPELHTWLQVERARLIFDEINDLVGQCNNTRRWLQLVGPEEFFQFQCYMKQVPPIHNPSR